jgi:hypothetical protein
VLEDAFTHRQAPIAAGAVAVQDVFLDYAEQAADGSGGA